MVCLKSQTWILEFPYPHPLPAQHFLYGTVFPYSILVAQAKLMCLKPETQRNKSTNDSSNIVVQYQMDIGSVHFLYYSQSTVK